jgi:hypothetical protein
MKMRYGVDLLFCPTSETMNDLVATTLWRRRLGPGSGAVDEPDEANALMALICALNRCR